MTLPKTTGDAKIAISQPLTDRVTTVTSVTTDFEQDLTTTNSGNYPSEWHAILEELRQTKSPNWLSDERWVELLSDAEAFLSTWGSSAERLGWTALDLFGVHPIAPAVRFDVMGLIPMLTGGEVIGLTDAVATIRRPSGAILTYRRPEPGAVLLSEVKS